MNGRISASLLVATLFLAAQEAPSVQTSAVAAAPSGPYLVVLGIAQDGGVPQAGSLDHPGWSDASRAHLVASLGLVDPRTGKRWMFDATPDFRRQWHDLLSAPGARQSGLPLDGVFLTHAHIGHYTGLMFLGHESMGADGVPVHAMPRMAAFLAGNGPWSQLVAYGNIDVRVMSAGVAVALADDLTVTPLLVPHRQEFSEVVGYRIDGPDRSALFIPDIDSWEEWEDAGTRIEDLIGEVDVAYLDATFFENGEIPGRDMSGFPHPFVTHSIRRFSTLAADLRSRVRFIHLNHTNGALDAEGPERAAVRRAGHRVAERGEIVPLAVADE